MAAREVEAHLLQQRVAHLETVLTGVTGFSSSLGSIAGGGGASTTGVMAGPAAGRSATPPRMARAPSGMSGWYGRLLLFVQFVRVQYCAFVQRHCAHGVSSFLLGLAG